MDFERMRKEIPALLDRVYLNTGTSGPMPRGAVAAEIELLETLTREGLAAPPGMRAYSAALDEARAAVAKLIKAPVDCVALTHSTSEGIGIVAAGLDWKTGDEIVISDLEHISGIAPWLHLAATRGARVINVASEGGLVDPERIEAALSDRTRLVCMSHVSYATGAVMPVAQVCAAARRRGVLSLIDGAQGAGHLPVDVEALGCDFYALPGQKWLLGPEGTGALYVAQGALGRLDPTRIGWASLGNEAAAPGSYSLHGDARRFETGTVHAPAFAGLAESIRFIEGAGVKAIFARAVELSALAREGLAALRGVEILSPASAPSGLLTFSVKGRDPDMVVRALWAQSRIIIRSIPSPRGVRASFHAFNTPGDVDALVTAVAGLLRQEL